MRIGALEAGGTKMVCAIGDEHGHIEQKISIPTTTPEETIPQIIAYFRENGPVDRLGIAAFGPVDVNPQSPRYGTILDTPKLAWKQYPLLRELQNALQIPMALDTDVNAACLGEMIFGTAKELENVLYLTVGTGIGAGIAVGGKLVHGMLHPEAGHILMHPVKGDEGHCICPYHDNCFEGLASGPSMEARWGRKAYELTACDEAWDLESDYIARALVQYIMTVSPQRIILGGGVMHQEQLFAQIRDKVKVLLGGYLNTPELEDMDSYICPSSLRDAQGILGCIALAVRLNI